MDSRAAKGIAANITVIAQCTARIAVIDGSENSVRYSDASMETRSNDCERIDKAQSSIAQWLQQPMARGNGMIEALAKAHRALDGDSNDDEHDALVQLVEAVEQGQ
jgi:hypothetical protein